MSDDPVLVTTPTGNTGRHALAAVLASGRPARVLTRDPERLPADARRACEVVVGDLRDGPSLARAVAGVGTAFFCVPQSPDPADLDSYYRGFTGPFAAAAAAAGLRRVVSVSGGDDGPDGRGPGAALRVMEGILNPAVPAARHLRCGYFMENLLHQAEAIAHAGVFTPPLPPDVPLAFVAARDIGAAAGRLVLDPDWSGVAAVEAYGPAKLTCPRPPKSSPPRSAGRSATQSPRPRSGSPNSSATA